MSYGVIAREGEGYLALCPERDIASQGCTIEEAGENLQEAITLFYETASPAEIQTRLQDEIYVTRVEVAVGWTPDSFRATSLFVPRTPRFY